MNGTIGRPSKLRQHTQNASNQLQLFFEIAVLFIKMLAEVFYSVVRRFIKKECKDVSGEIVLITGTGHGIGRELAIQYIKLGSEVICVDINKQNNLETVRIANALQLGTAHEYTCDVTNRDDVFELAKKILNDVGHVSVILNNAGIMPSHSFLNHNAQEVRTLFDVNVLAHVWVLQAFLPHMLSKRRGHIVAISSMAGICGLTNLVPYCATKFAVRGLMEALYEELRLDGLDQAINTTIIYPYMVDTGLCKKPKFRFPNALGFLSPRDAATAIIEAQRSNTLEASIPNNLLYLNNVFRCLPYKCGFLFKDFIDSGVESDL